MHGHLRGGNGPASRPWPVAQPVDALGDDAFGPRADVPLGQADLCGGVRVRLPLRQEQHGPRAQG